MKLTKTPKKQNKILFLFLNLIGQVVQLKLVDGRRIEGLFYSVSETVPPQFLLKQVRYVENNKRSQKLLKTVDCLELRLSEIDFLDCKDIFFANEKTEYRVREFLTDSEISQKEKFGLLKKEKKLVKWEPEDDVNENLPSYDLDHLDDDFDDTPTSTSKNQWDMYESNNIKSTYVETDYTTEIEWEKISKEEIKNAGKMAKEILSSNDNVDNVHVRMERNMLRKGDSNLDEEELHSSVVRDKETKQTELEKQKDAKRKKKERRLRVNDLKVFQKQPRKLSKILLKRIKDDNVHKSRSRAMSTPTVKKSTSLLRQMSYLKLRKSILNPKNPKNKNRLQKSYSYRIIGYSLDPGTPKVSAEIKKQFAKYVIEKGKTSSCEKEKQISELKNFLDDFNERKIVTKSERRLSLSKVSKKQATKIIRNPNNIKKEKDLKKKNSLKEKEKKNFKFNINAKVFKPGASFQPRRQPYINKNIPMIPQMINPVPQLMNYQFPGPMSPPQYRYQPTQLINQQRFSHQSRQNHRPKFLIEKRIEKKYIREVYAQTMAKKIKKKKRDLEKTKKSWGSKQVTYQSIPKQMSPQKRRGQQMYPNYNIPQQMVQQQGGYPPRQFQPYPQMQPNYNMPTPQPYYQQPPQPPYGYPQNVPPQQFFQPPQYGGMNYRNDY